MGNTEETMRQYAMARHDAEEAMKAATQRIAEIGKQRQNVIDPELKKTLVMDMYQAEYEKDRAEAIYKKMDAEYNMLRRQRAKELEKQAVSLAEGMKFRR